MMKLFSRFMLPIAGGIFALLVYLYLTLPDVRSMVSVNPHTTAFMEMRVHEAKAVGYLPRHEHQFVPYSEISNYLKRAVLIAEDDSFWTHEGVDFIQLRRSVEDSFKRGTAMRGASTITQQLAKNLYLSPSRSPLRKLRELIIARRLEAELSKLRIFELYLNLIEWGAGIWGAEAASQWYFETSASSLNPRQAALLAAAIINPRVLDPAHPNGRLKQRQRMILKRMGISLDEVPSPVALPNIDFLDFEETGFNFSH